MKYSIVYSIIIYSISLFFSSSAIANHQDDMLAVNAIYVHGTTIYAAIENPDDHLFVSHDSGINWSEMPLPHISNQTANFITKIFAINNDIYIGTAIPNPEHPHVGGGLWISHNKGASWEYISDKTPNFYNNWINDIYATDNGTNIDIYVATMGGGLAVSNDSGKNWRSYSNGTLGWTSDFVRKIYVTGSNIYAATTFAPNPNAKDDDVGGVTFSHDRGHTWSTVIPNTSDWITAVTAIDNKIYALTHGDTLSKGGLSIGDYQGTNWSHKSVDPDKYGYSYPNMIATIGAHLFVVTENGGLFVSSNDGTSWDNLIDSNIYDLCVANQSLYAATYNSILKCSYDNTKWGCHTIKQWENN